MRTYSHSCADASTELNPFRVNLAVSQKVVSGKCDYRTAAGMSKRTLLMTRQLLTNFAHQSVSSVRKVRSLAKGISLFHSLSKGWPLAEIVVGVLS